MNKGHDVEYCEGKSGVGEVVMFEKENIEVLKKAYTCLPP